MTKRLFGEIAPGVFEFKAGHRNHNPAAKRFWARYVVIPKLSEDQLRRLHQCEIARGHELLAPQIAEIFRLGKVPAPPKESLETLERFLEQNMIDELDRRCEEAVGCSVMPWYKTHAHLARRLGMFHAADWKVLREGVGGLSRGVEVEAVELAFGDD